MTPNGFKEGDLILNTVTGSRCEFKGYTYDGLQIVMRLDKPGSVFFRLPTRIFTKFNISNEEDYNETAWV